MKKILSLILFLSVSTVFAQDMKSLQASTEKVYSLTYTLDMESLLDNTYPKVFEIGSREDMLEGLKNAFDNEYMSVTFPNKMADFSYGEIKTIGKQKFCVIKYDNVMIVNLKDNVDKEGVKLLLQGFRENFDKADYDKKRKIINVADRATMIAVADETTDNQWKFVNYEPSLFDLLFDEDVKKELGL